jgi:hypothetical protein
MAKKSKRPPARKQRAVQRPAAPPRPRADSAPAVADDLRADAEQDDYAAGALPVSESDGPMPLPPADTESEAPERPQLAASTGTSPSATASERRRVGRVDPTAPPQRPGQRAKSGRTLSTAAMFEPLPTEDPAIPFDRVPYVPGDLRRVLAIAGVMVVLVVVADVVVNAVVK